MYTGNYETQSLTEYYNVSATDKQFQSKTYK